MWLFCCRPARQLYTGVVTLFTCWTSAVVDLNSSMYREPIMSLCLDKALSPSVSSLNRTKASPVALPSGFLTKRTPSSSSSTSHGSSPPLKKSIWQENSLICLLSALVRVSPLVWPSSRTAVLSFVWWPAHLALGTLEPRSCYLAQDNISNVVVFDANYARVKYYWLE